MNTINRILVLFLLGTGAAARAQSTAFTYQGRLAANGLPYTGLAEMQFALFSTQSGGSAVAVNTPTVSSVNVSAGLFTLSLDFGAAAFPGSDRWLEIQVRTNAGAFNTLKARQKLTPAPYSLMAADVASGNVARLSVSDTTVQATAHPLVTGGFITSAVVDTPGSGYTTAPTVTVNANGPGGGAVITPTVSGGAVTALNVQNAGSGYTGSPTLTIGAPPPNNFQVFVTSNFFPNVNIFSNPANVFVGDGAGLSNVWKAGGNAGANPASGNFLGTTDDQPLEFKVAGRRALRIEPNTGGDAPNLIGGSVSNVVAPGVMGAVIAGGGSTNYFIGFNSVSADFGAIGGGTQNSIQSNAGDSSIGGGRKNTVQATGSSIGGGSDNTIQTNSASSTIGGGSFNIIHTNARNSTISGGVDNTIHANAGNATIGGGLENSIGAGVFDATIPGGSQNSVIDHYGFAAGHHATAGYGCFVWADSRDDEFASTFSDQFAVRARGGMLLAANVQMGTNSSDYHRLEVGGGNSSGFLYGSYPKWGDGIHLGYNYYADANGGNHIIAPDGATSRLTVGYGEIILAVGAIPFPPTAEKLVVNTSSVTVNGTFNNNSDRNAKRDFAPVSPSQILDKVTRLPLSEWSYQDDQHTRHVGPMAQDFHSTFNVGTDDKHIAPMDEGGVALAAIQGLNQRLTEELKRRDAENAELNRRLERLEQLLKQQNGGGR